MILDSSMSQPIAPSVAVNSMDQATGHGISGPGHGPLPSVPPTSHLPGPPAGPPPPPPNPPAPSMAIKPLAGANGWYYDKIELRRTPSLMDGINYEKEQRYRREGARFIVKVGSKLNLRYDTMATGVVYYHRFYCCHSFKQFPRYLTASCCLFLAGKVEETPKKCKDIIKTARAFLSDQQFATFGEDPKEELLTLERILLQTMRFDLQVDHPYSHLLRYAKSLKGDKEKLQKMVQMAWTFINDSLCTTICLQWEPEIIAIALMFLAGKLSKFEIVDWNGRTATQRKWWDMFVEDITEPVLEDICHQVLDLYSTPVPDTPQDSPPPSPGPSSIASGGKVLNSVSGPGLHSANSQVGPAPSAPPSSAAQTSLIAPVQGAGAYSQPLSQPSSGQYRYSSTSSSAPSGQAPIPVVPPRGANASSSSWDPTSSFYGNNFRQFNYAGGPPMPGYHPGPAGAPPGQPPPPNFPPGPLPASSAPYANSVPAVASLQPGPLAGPPLHHRKP